MFSWNSLKSEFLSMKNPSLIFVSNLKMKVNVNSRYCLVIRTLRCGCSNQGLNPGLGSVSHCCGKSAFIFQIANVKLCFYQNRIIYEKEISHIRFLLPLKQYLQDSKCLFLHIGNSEVWIEQVNVTD